MFKAAIAAAQPTLCVPPQLPPRRPGRTIVIGAGKASAAMAKAVEDNWIGDLSGVVVTRYGYGVPCKRIEIIEAAHPVPDAASVTAARAHPRRGERAQPDDLVLCLISGGGSSLLVAPLRDLTLDDKQAINRALLQVGREHQRDELRAPPSVGDQGRAPRGGLPSGQSGDAAPVRRARR